MIASTIFGFWFFMSVLVIAFAASVTLIAFASNPTGLLLLGVIAFWIVKKIHKSNR